MKMRKTALIIIALFLFSVISVAALSSGDAKQNWLDAKEKRMGLEDVYRQAQLDYASNKSDENDKKVVDSAKDILNAALDEAEAWLNWKKTEAQESNDISDDLKSRIETDADSNIDKIAELRNDVDGIQNRAGAGLVFLKIVGKYAELLTDVARDTSYIRTEQANKRADKIDDYESRLREAAEGNDDLIAKLDIAKSEMETARSKINMAENAYDNVKIPGTPLIKFAEGNGYLRQANSNMVNAVVQLQYVYSTMVRGT